MKKILWAAALLISCDSRCQQVMELDSIFSVISNSSPLLKSYEAQIRSLDEAAKGARSWDAPLISTGFWMTPYDPSLWKKQANGSTGMGQYMISAQQMFPNRKKLDADEKYMQAMSSVDKEKKKASLNELHAAAKQYYYQWIILEKKLSVLYQDSLLLDFMIKNAELRYQNNLGRISAYYKIKASLGNIEIQRIRLEEGINQKRIQLNTLMNRDKATSFDIDTSSRINTYTDMPSDSLSISQNRSDIRAIENDIRLISLQQEAEQDKLKPEFGVRYDNMFGFGGLPMQYSLMGMVRLPMVKWSSKASKANAESLRWKAESLSQQKQTMINEATGLSYGIQREIASKQKQIRLFQNNIIPALNKNFQTMQLGYEQNTEELFTLFDAWETLNMTQLEYLDQLQDLMMMQVELERILEIK
jgi:outer membrane protein TolC